MSPNRRSLLAFATYAAAWLGPNLLLLLSTPTLASWVKLAASAAILVVLHTWTNRLSLAMLLALPWFILLPPDLYYSYIFGQPPSASVFAAVAYTNPQEAGDALQGRIPTLLTLLAISLLIWLWAYLCARRTHIAIPGLIRFASAGAVLIMIAVPLVALLPRFSGLEVFMRQASDRAIGRDALPWGIDRVRHVFPYGRVVSLEEYLVGERNSADLQNRLRSFSFHASRQPGAPAQSAEVYVFVVGESSRRAQWGLSGYARNTTPRLAAEPDVVFLSNAISAWSLTHQSIPTMLTRKPDTDHGRLFAEKSVMSLFREAGFKTYWVSNQARPTGAGNTLDQIVREADRSAWTNATGNYSSGDQSYDEEILPLLDRVLADGERKRMIVIHMIGSHDFYDRRYPPAFDRFRPSMSDAGRTDDSNPSNKPYVINSYDNSIAYTDHVLDEVIGRLKRTGAISSLYFASDHGESLFDGDCDFFGHGNRSRANFEIASLIWTSPEYALAFPQKLAAIRSHRAAPIGATNIFHTLAGLAGVKSPASDATKDLTSPQFRAGRRFINSPQAIDWDTATFDGACDIVEPSSTPAAP